VTDWLKQATLVCPECGYEFATRSTAGSLSIEIPPGEPRQCKHGGMGPTGRRCPHISEAFAEADRSEQTLG
jgi:hypothetical protein